MTLDLDALQKLADEATPGEWRVVKGRSNWIDAGQYDEVLAGEPPECAAYCYGGSSRHSLGDADAAFIAAARTAVPELIAEIRRLREENAGLRENQAVDFDRIAVAVSVTKQPEETGCDGE